MSSPTHLPNPARHQPMALLLRPLSILLRSFVGMLLSRLQTGILTVHLPDGTMLSNAPPASGQDGPTAMIFIRRWRAVRRLFIGGDLGFAEAFIDGDWTSPDLPSLLLLAAKNETALNGRLDGTLLSRVLARRLHRRNHNSREGSRRNIPAHYDLGNEFYGAWLDAGMTYSAALYSEPGMSLEAAQNAKLDCVLGALDVTPGSDVLEIGCGWGGLAERLAASGARVAALTLSHAQATHARARLAPYGEKTCVRLQDYREEAGRYDRIVSVEMFEAVGEAYWPVFFRMLQNCLRPGGIAVLQVITIAESRFEAYARRPDFIQAHVFPGGMLPSPRRLWDAAARAGFAMHEVVQFPHSYAETLAEWGRRFERALSDLRALGIDDEFARKWRYYLAYCEAGFRAELLGVGIYRLVRQEQAA